MSPARTTRTNRRRNPSPDRTQADRFRKKALELIDRGGKVVIGYERLAIGGSKGYATLLVKDKEKKPRKGGDKQAL